MTRYRSPVLVCLVGLAPASALALPPRPPPGPAEPLEIAAPGGRELELSVGVRAEKSPVQAEAAGFLALTVPLERIAAPRRLVAVADPPNPEPAEAAGATDGSATGATEPAPAELSRRDALAAAAVGRSGVLSRLARGAVSAAEKRDRTNERERALDGLVSRSRWSAVLPELRVRAARTRDESLRLTPTTDDPYRFTLAGGDAVVLEGTATFRLARLVFADDELAVERLRLEHRRAAERLAARVLERVFAWHAALSHLAGASEDERPRFELEKAAAHAELDVLTAGWFTLELERLELRPDGARAASPRSEPLDVAALSAKPQASCWPKPETDSPTSCGASTR